ncbi:hypothetical protein [Mesorhizobium amorphae]|uniref:hypothetical protein n=1 Tax=Mesorhizobium amorphae TaxID=71433 RepID=UPI0011844856|nr:hypothetical protein [Mesorhizobium amorphae]
MYSSNNRLHHKAPQPDLWWQNAGRNAHTPDEVTPHGPGFHTPFDMVSAQFAPRSAVRSSGIRFSGMYASTRHNRCFAQLAQSARSRAKGDYFPFELMFQLSELPFLG